MLSCGTRSNKGSGEINTNSTDTLNTQAVAPDQSSAQANQQPPVFMDQTHTRCDSLGLHVWIEDGSVWLDIDKDTWVKVKYSDFYRIDGAFGKGPYMLYENNGDPAKCVLLSNYNEVTMDEIGLSILTASHKVIITCVEEIIACVLNDEMKLGLAPLIDNPDFLPIGLKDVSTKTLNKTVAVDMNGQEMEIEFATWIPRYAFLTDDDGQQHCIIMSSNWNIMIDDCPGIFRERYEGETKRYFDYYIPEYKDKGEISGSFEHPDDLHFVIAGTSDPLGLGLGRSYELEHIPLYD